METIEKIRILMTLALAVSGLGLALGGIAFFLDNNRDRRSKLRPMIVVCTIGLCLSLTNGEPYIVITDGVDTVKIKVTDGIYEKYNPGDVYEHDADPVQFDTAPSTDVKAN